MFCFSSYFVAIKSLDVFIKAEETIKKDMWEEDNG